MSSTITLAASNEDDAAFNKRISQAIQASLSHLETSVALIKDPNLFPTYGNHDLTWQLNKSHKWTAGFYPGALWQGYQLSGDTRFQEWAKQWTESLADQTHDTGSHDLGFKFMATYGQALAISHDIDVGAYQQIMLFAANTLADRYHKNIQLLSSDWDDKYFENSIPVVIDIMMNLELLLWAAENGGDTQWAEIAKDHALKTYQDFIREDGSSYHIVRYNKTTGEVINKGTLQGDGDETTWSRGHTWIIYGMVVMYRYTHDDIYLQYAQTLTDYFIKQLPDDGIAMWDLDSKVLQPDTSASAIFASALIELSGYIQQQTKQAAYIQTYKRILNSLISTPYFIKDITKAPIINKSVHYYTKPNAIDVPAIFTDYYFLEALNRYQQKHIHNH
ncbi:MULTISPECIES: glycoside hydrolase family 88 protein [unclassified Psychromonas]|uniref:glycoside hydrolase family 88 protein n=1 Tax=unclassified Psychromonas TaxID=2614957 RepID=UPI0015F0C829|nr:glycoside hydrolase family 88 protein [Psychromonas sp. B3M02]